MPIFRWRLLGDALVAGMFLLTALVPSVAQPRRVLLLYSYGPHFAPWNVISGQFREDLVRQAPYPIDLYEASLQSERFGRSNEEQSFSDYLRALFAEQKLDLVVAMGAQAARFFLQHRPQLFPMTPLLVTGADQRTLSDIPFSSNDTAVASTFDQKKPIENILQVLPNTTNIAVVIGASPLDKFWTDQDRRAFQPLAARVHFEWLNELSTEEMVARVAALPLHSAVYYAQVHVDARGAPQEDDRVLSRIHKAASAPIFSWIDIHFGQGIVGGPLLSTREIARNSAAAAIRILGGETAADIKTPTLGLSAPTFDWRELQRWNISEAVLPPGSAIYFRGPSVWQQYRWQILATCAVFLLQAISIVWLIYEHRRRNLAEIQSRNAMAELSYMDRRASAGELSASIAHEVSQPLTGIVARASVALHWLRAAKPDLEKVGATLEEIVESGHRAGDIVAGVRAIFKKGSVVSSPVQINAVIMAVLEVARIDLQKRSIEVHTRLEDDLPLVTGNKVQLQQVVLNLVTNAIEAMDSTQRRILTVQSLRSAPAVVTVSIADTGSGVDPADFDQLFEPLFTTKAQGMGMGLSICRSIVMSHGGRIWVSAGPSGGTTFRFELPTRIDSK